MERKEVSAILVLYCNECVKGNQHNCQVGEIRPTSRLKGWLCQTNFELKQSFSHNFVKFTNNELDDLYAIDEAIDIVCALS